MAGRTYSVVLNDLCPVHGLPPGAVYPPMVRHKRRGEDCRDAQLRLYAEARRG